MKKFNPATHRGFLAEDGNIVVVPIAEEVLALPKMEPAEFGDPFAPRVELAKQLSALGHVIDAQIDVWGWGAENTMRLRRLYGYSQVPDAFGTVQILVPPAKK